MEGVWAEREPFSPQHSLHGGPGETFVEIADAFYTCSKVSTSTKSDSRKSEESLAKSDSQRVTQCPCEAKVMFLSDSISRVFCVVGAVTLRPVGHARASSWPAPSELPEDGKDEVKACSIRITCTFHL